VSDTVDKNKTNVVDEFFKNSAEDEKYIISINHFHGDDYIDTRLFFRPDGKKEFLPTRKGISISVDHLGNLISALEKAKTRIDGGNNLKEMQSGKG